MNNGSRYYIGNNISKAYFHLYSNYVHSAYFQMSDTYTNLNVTLLNSYCTSCRITRMFFKFWSNYKVGYMLLLINSYSVCFVYIHVSFNACLKHNIDEQANTPSMTGKISSRSEVKTKRLKSSLNQQTSDWLYSRQ